jgi:hypothetical protein
MIVTNSESKNHHCKSKPAELSDFKARTIYDILSPRFDPKTSENCQKLFPKTRFWLAKTKTVDLESKGVKIPVKPSKLKKSVETTRAKLPSIKTVVQDFAR